MYIHLYISKNWNSVFTFSGCPSLLGSDIKTHKILRIKTKGLNRNLNPLSISLIKVLHKLLSDRGVPFLLKKTKKQQVYDSFIFSFPFSLPLPLAVFSVSCNILMKGWVLYCPFQLSLFGEKCNKLNRCTKQIIF